MLTPFLQKKERNKQEAQGPDCSPEKHLHNTMIIPYSTMVINKIKEMPSLFYNLQHKDTMGFENYVIHNSPFWQKVKNSVDLKFKS